MNIDVKQEGSSTIVVINTDALIKDEAMVFKKSMVELLDSGQKHLKIDLRRTKFIDSSGIGKLLFLNKKLGQSGGSLEISAISPELYDFLDSLAITKVIKIIKPGS